MAATRLSAPPTTTWMRTAAASSGNGGLLKLGGELFSFGRAQPLEQLEGFPAGATGDRGFAPRGIHGGKATLCLRLPKGGPELPAEIKRSLQTRRGLLQASLRLGKPAKGVQGDRLAKAITELDEDR